MQTSRLFEDAHIFNGFKTAILERKIAEFNYFSTYGEKTRRRVEPMQLWFKSKAWYLKAFCLTRQDMRLFKLTRVRDLTVTSEAFGERDLFIPPPKEPEARDKQDIFLRLKIAPEMTYRILDEFFYDNAERQPDGSHIVSIWWPEDDWVYGKILSFGTFAEVLEPQHIKEIIRKKAKEISEMYS